MAGSGRSPYDLHIHTEWSYDATSTVEEVFRAAGELGVTTIAIADHHVMDAVPEALEAASRHPGIRYIVAAELTVTTSVGMADLVCLGLPEGPGGQLAAVLDEYHEWQRRQALWMVAAMEALGIEYSEDEHARVLASYRPAKAIELQGRTHVKNELWREYLKGRGIIASDDQYQGFFRRMAEAYRPREGYPPVEAVAPVVKSTGAIMSVAHPTGLFDGADRKRMDLLVRECLLDGIECGHRSVPDELVPVYRGYCRERGLVSTAGGDAHELGMLPGRLGMHKGEAAWLEEVLERLPAPG